MSIALADNFLEKVRHYPDLVDELVHFLNQSFSADNMFHKIAPTPIPEIAPEPWLLGTSDKSAIMAAEKGLPFVFGHFMSNQNGPEILQNYYKEYTGKNPKAFVTVSVICAETTEEAEELALSNALFKVLQDKGESLGGVPSMEDVKDYSFSKEELQTIEELQKRHIVGNPLQVKGKLEEIANLYNVDEVMIVTITHSYKAREKSYELLAKEFGIKK